jgi:hypothetical protein
MADKPNPLASLSEEQLRRIAEILGGSAKQRTVIAPVVAHVEAPYWLVTDGYFETIIDYRDAQSAEIAFDKAQDPLQPWYFHGHHGELAGSSKAITREEYIAWLRR